MKIDQTVSGDMPLSRFEMETSTVTGVKSYPLPPQLATPSELTPHEAKAITEAVNPLIADTFALYVKTKNFHWYVYGCTSTTTIICSMIRLQASSNQ